SALSRVLLHRSGIERCPGGKTRIRRRYQNSLLVAKRRVKNGRWRDGYMAYPYHRRLFEEAQELAKKMWVQSKSFTKDHLIGPAFSARVRTLKAGGSVKRLATEKTSKGPQKSKTSTSSKSRMTTVRGSFMNLPPAICRHDGR